MPGGRHGNDDGDGDDDGGDGDGEAMEDEFLDDSELAGLATTPRPRGRPKGSTKGTKGTKGQRGGKTAAGSSQVADNPEVASASSTPRAAPKARYSMKRILSPHYIPPPAPLEGDSFVPKPTPHEIESMNQAEREYHDRGRHNDILAVSLKTLGILE